VQAAPPIRTILLVYVSTGEQAQIVRLAQTQGTPWLISRPPGNIGGLVWVFLRPDASSLRIRRGRYLRMCAWICSEAPRRIGNGPYEWHFDPSLPQSVGQYAQVVAPDRDADDVRDASDVNRPFVISGAFTDDELITLVDFIRTSPRVPLEPSNVVQGLNPITSIRRVPSAPTAATVSLELPTGMYQIVVASRAAGAWVISDTSTWFY
jgi:hypothetical protein